MFAVFGKSLKKEYNKKNITKTDIERFNNKRGAYIVSPEFFDIKRCYEFLELSKNQTDIRPLYIAEQKQCLDKKGKIIINKKTNQPKVKYQKLFGVSELENKEQ